MKYLLILVLFVGGCTTEVVEVEKVVEKTVEVEKVVEVNRTCNDGEYTLGKRVLSFGSLSVSEFSESEILFDFSESDITDQVKYNEDLESFNFDNMYEVVSGGNSYYFRFGWSLFDGDNTRFKFVEWLGGKFPITSGYHEFFMVESELCQVGERSITFIGDSTTWWNDGKYMRKMLDSKLDGFVFVGSKTDVFGYGHEGEGGDGTRQVLSRLDKIAHSDVYILMIGTNDGHNDTVANIKEIVRRLLKRTDSIILVSTLLPRNDEKDYRNTLINQSLVEGISGISNRVKVINTGGYFRTLDWVGLMPDRIHPNKVGYEYITNFIANEIMNTL